MMSDEGVALLRMFAVSCISTMNVDSPRASWSEAPTRVKMRSKMPRRAFEAGTNEPAWLRRTISATWRRYVDFPPMFGPVMTWMPLRSRTMSVWLGMKRSEAICSMTGWRPSSTQISTSSESAART